MLPFAARQHFQTRDTIRNQIRSMSSKNCSVISRLAQRDLVESPIYSGIRLRSRQPLNKV